MRDVVTPANERCRDIVMASLIGGAHTWTDPCIMDSGKSFAPDKLIADLFNMDVSRMCSIINPLSPGISTMHSEIRSLVQVMAWQHVGAMSPLN